MIVRSARILLANLVRELMEIEAQARLWIGARQPVVGRDGNDRLRELREVDADALRLPLQLAERRLELLQQRGVAVVGVPPVLQLRQLDGATAVRVDLGEYLHDIVCAETFRRRFR